MKGRWRDGSTHVMFRPHDLIEKLVALIPAPQANLVRYHGVLAAHARRRDAVVSDRRRHRRDGDAHPASPASATDDDAYDPPFR